MAGTAAAPEKASYIFTNKQGGKFVRVDAFELRLTGEEHLLCQVIWKVRLKIIAKAEKSIELPYTFRENMNFEGAGIEKPVSIGSPKKSLDKDWGMHLLGEKIPGNAEERANEIAKRSGMMTFRIPRNEGIVLLSSLIWVCNATGARPESITAEENSKHIQSEKMDLLDSIMHAEYDVIEEDKIVKGFNKVQLDILKNILHEMKTRLVDGTPAKNDWMRSDETQAGEKIFQTQELIMKCFPDPLDTAKKAEILEATEAIARQKNDESDDSGKTFW